MSAVQPASVEHRLTAADGPSPEEIREVLGALDDDDWQTLADPPSRLPRIGLLQSQQRPSGATLRNWFFASTSDGKLAGQLSYYTYSLWKSFGASGDLSPALLGADEPRLLAVHDFLSLSEDRLGHVGPRMAYLGLASRYGSGSRAALTAWRLIEPMQLLAPDEQVSEPAPPTDADGSAADEGQQLLLDGNLGDADAAVAGVPADPHIDEDATPTPEPADGAPGPGPGLAPGSDAWAPATEPTATGPTVDDPDFDAADIDPADAAEIDAHDQFTAAERERLTALLEELRTRSPHAQAAAEHAVETVTLGRAVPAQERGQLDDWSTNLATAATTIRAATGLEPRDDVASLNAAVQTWLAHRDDVGQAMREAAVNRKVIERLEATRAEREANLATIDLAYRGASPQVRQALSVGLASAQSELADVVSQLERSVAHQEALQRRRNRSPILAPDAAIPLAAPDPDPDDIEPDYYGDDSLAEPSAAAPGLQWWHYTWSAVLLIGSLGLGIAVGGSAGMDRLGWSMAALTWWALIGPVVVLNASARWRWTTAVGLALAGAIFATWAYQSSAVCGMSSVVAAFATVPVGLGFTAIAVWWQARRQPVESAAGGPPWLLAVTWFVFAFALVFLMSVLTTPINCTVG
jgi:hypothetical protein